MKDMKKYITFIFLFAVVTFGYAQEKGTVLIKNGTVLTITKGNLEGTVVLIRDGKISKIGKGLKAPSGAKTIDASGMYVMPGIIDAHSHIALDAVNEATSPSAK